jgi:hypothetical protein
VPKRVGRAHLPVTIVKNSQEHVKNCTTALGSRFNLVYGENLDNSLEHKTQER